MTERKDSKRFNSTEEGRKAYVTYYEKEIGDINQRHIVDTEKDKEGYYKWQRLRQAFTSQTSRKIQRELSVRLHFLRCFLHKNDTLIDVGCGNGWYLQQLRRKGYRNLSGIDIGNGVIEEGLRKGLNVKVGDMHQLDFPEDSFDVIFCSHALEHAYSPSLVLREFRKVLKNEGKVVIVLPIEQQPSIYHACAFPNTEAVEQILKSAGFNILYSRVMYHQIWVCGIINKSGGEEGFPHHKISTRTWKVTAILYLHFKLNNIFDFVTKNLNNARGKLSLFFSRTLPQKNKKS